MVFVRGSYEPLVSSNYFAFSSFRTASWTTIRVNSGFKLSLALIGSFLLLLLVSAVTDY